MHYTFILSYIQNSLTLNTNIPTYYFKYIVHLKSFKIFLIRTVAGKLFVVVAVTQLLLQELNNLV